MMRTFALFLALCSIAGNLLAQTPPDPLGELAGTTTRQWSVIGTTSATGAACATGRAQSMSTAEALATTVLRRLSLASFDPQPWSSVASSAAEGAWLSACWGWSLTLARSPIELPDAWAAFVPGWAAFPEAIDWTSIASLAVDKDSNLDFPARTYQLLQHAEVITDRFQEIPATVPDILIPLLILRAEKKNWAIPSAWWRFALTNHWAEELLIEHRREGSLTRPLCSLLESLASDGEGHAGHRPPGELTGVQIFMLKGMPLREVERYLAGDPVEARSGSGWYVLRKAVAVNRTRLAWGAVAGVLVLVAGGVVWRSRARETESAQIAAAQKALAERERIYARAVTELLREAIPDADPRYPDLSSIMGAGFKRLYFRLETGGFAADPAVDQELRRLWANVYTGFGSNKAAGLGEYAEVSLRNGLSWLRELYGNEHVEVAATLHQLAGVMLYRRRPMEAETTCREALALREKLIGPSSPEAIDTRSLLARILADREELAAADAEAQRVIELSGNTPSAGNELHLASMYVLRGRLALKRQDYTSAEPLLSNALRVQMALLPLRDPEVTATLVDGSPSGNR